MKNYMLLFLGLTILAITACKKDKEDDKYAVYNFFKENGVPTQTFTVQAGQQQVITTTGGATITFYSTSFSDVNGNVVNGPVTVEVREIYTKKDMICSDAPTVSNGELLLSGGELNITAKKNNEPLYVNQSSRPFVSIPANDTIQMSLFKGATAPNSVPDSTYFSLVNWLLDSTQVALNAGRYDFPLPDFGWINCDVFNWNDITPDSVKLQLPNGFNYFNSVCYMSIDGSNTVAKLGGMNNQGLFGGYGIPHNLNIHIATISLINGNYYFSVAPATINGQTYTSVINKKSLQEIFTELNNLP